MDRAGKYALDAAKEITIARMSNTEIRVTKEGGANVAAFYEEIFNKIRELSQKIED